MLMYFSQDKKTWTLSFPSIFSKNTKQVEKRS